MKVIRKNIRITPLFETLWLVFLVITFAFTPFGVSDHIIWLCLATFYYYFFRSVNKPVVIHAKIPTYMKIDILFMLFFYILFYLPYQFSVLGLADLNKSLFISETFVQYTNPSILASTIGLVAFMLGYNRNFQISKLKASTEIPYKNIYLIVLILMMLFAALFMVTSFKGMISGAYGGSNVGSTAENGIYFLVTHFAMLTVAIAVYYLSQGIKFPFLLIAACAFCVLWCLLLLVLGDRNNFFIIALIGAVGIFTYVRKIKVLGMALAIFSALTIYNAVELSRTAQERSVDAIIEVMLADNQESRSILEGSFYNTTITSRAAMALVPKRHDYFYGKFKVIGFAGIIPFSRALFVDKNDPYTTSADFLTEGVLGPTATWSVGSNIISDIYIDLGIMGVGLVMYLVGLFGKYVQHQTTIHQQSMKWAVLYLIVVALYTELPRYTLSFPIRNIVWTLLIFYFYSLFFTKKNASK